jgi:hypothetical protein
MEPGNDLELLHIEIETIWTTDSRGRVNGRELVIASSSAGNAAVIGSAVPDHLVATLVEAITGAAPADDLSSPPAVLQHCRRLLEDTRGPLDLTSGPSYLIPDSLAFSSQVQLLRSDATDVAALRGANPGNWQTDEWQRLLDGVLGPWAMATHDGEIISICHAPVSTARGAEAGVWTHPEFRGRRAAICSTVRRSTLTRRQPQC